MLWIKSSGLTGWHLTVGRERVGIPPQYPPGWDTVTRAERVLLLFPAAAPQLVSAASQRRPSSLFHGEFSLHRSRSRDVDSDTAECSQSIF